MKRYFIIIVLSLLIVGLIIWEQIFISNCLTVLKEKTTTIYNQIQTSENVNTKEILNNIEQLDVFWKEKEHWLYLVINYKDMERTGEQITRLKTLSLQNDKKYAQQDAALLKYFVENYDNVMRIAFHNIW